MNAASQTRLHSNSRGGFIPRDDILLMEKISETTIMFIVLASRFNTLYPCIHVYLRIFTCVCVFVCVRACACVCVCVRACVCMCACLRAYRYMLSMFSPLMK